jgi:AcrR family transcriptional regulator
VPVSKESIVKASIKILKREGIEGLNMRAIAKKLDIKAASLYWHISGKLELYGEIAEQLCAEITLPQDTRNPEDCLLEICSAYRAMLLGTRDSVTILEESVPNTPRRIGIIKAQSGYLLKIGVDEQNLMTAGNLLNNYVLSFVADELRMKQRPTEAVKAFLEQLSPNDRLIFSSERDFDEQFLYGLQVIFAGLKKTGG